jgi:cyclic pyranopterin phosphate synthase
LNEIAIRVRHALGDQLRHRPRLRAALVAAENGYLRSKQALANHLPALIQPRPYKVMIAIMAGCNARCLGCRYERDFMLGQRLEYDAVVSVLDDLRDAGYYTVRLYGGEPTLHPELPRMIAAAGERGLRTYITTNGTTLTAQFERLYAAGLRDMSLGIYGIGAEYDEYTQRPGLFAKIERGLAHVRERHGAEIRMQMNCLVMRRSLRPGWLADMTTFARRFGMTMQFDLLHYSLPYFQEGPEGELKLQAEDRPQLEALVEEILALKRADPELVNADLPGIRSIPDWLMLGPEMRVPCNAAEMIWIGADGSVQLCYVCFPLGNIHERPLREILFGATHRRAAQDSFQLNCPNCHCSYNERVLRHGPSLRKYSRDA